MIGLVKELKKVMKKNGLSREKASRFLGCSAMTLHRWFNDNFSPSISSRRMIQEGIAKIREAYPEIKKKRLYLGFVSSFCPDLKLSEKQADFYEEVLTQMTFNELKKTFFHEGIDPETVSKGILKIAKRLDIPWSK